MRKGRLVAAFVSASLVVGACGVTAWTAAHEAAPGNLPVRLRHGTVFLTGSSANQTGPTDPAGRALYIVQFTGPVMPAYKSAVKGTGAELGDYLPENAFLVRMTGAQSQQVRGLGFVRGVTPYQPAMKLDRSLTGNLSAPVSVRVTSFDTRTKGAIAALTTAGVRPESIGAGTVTARLDARGLQSLVQSTDVVFVEPVRTNQLFNDKAAGVMGVTPVWQGSMTGNGQVVAISDTGLDTGKNDSSLHPDFQGQIKSLIALGKPNDASDTLAHGTHVAGSVLGTGAASNGLYKGMAPGAKLVFQSVEDKQGGLGGLPSDLGELFKQAYGEGARIHSNSWGVPAASGGAVYDGQSAAVDRFIWENPDYAILFAAGNDGDNNQDGKTDYASVSTPGTAKNAITVGASQNDRPDKKQGDNIAGMASFSSRGPTTDNRVKPDIVAPGTWIASTRASKADDSHFWAPHETNNRYGYMGGTSMATPLTAGATALVRQFYVEKLSITPRASLLKATLINGAAAMDQNLTWKDNGWGRVDLNGSLLTRGLKVVNEEKALQTGEGQTYSYTVKQGQPLKATLVWTDYPANPSADKTLVNDLDLTVTGPDGKSLTGNHMIASGPDHTNNVENVLVAAPQNGTYTVAVKGYNVPQGPQRFALVVSGNVDGGSGQPTPPPTDPNPNPPGPDKQAPTVRVTGPAEGSAVSGPITVSAEATDNVGVTRVIFYADGVEMGSVSTAPYEVTWTTESVPDGVHSLVANAYDAAGNVGISAPVRVNVANKAKAQQVEMQFTGKAQGFGTARYFVDVKAGGSVKANLGVNGYAAVSLVAQDSSGRQIAVGQEQLSFTAAAAGTYTISVTNYGGWADYALSLRYPPAEGTAVEKKAGKLSAQGERYQVHEIKVARAGGLSAAVTARESRADLDLYLVDSSGRTIAQATSPNLNPETVSAQVHPGTYKLYVVADSGQTDYQLTAVHP